MNFKLFQSRVDEHVGSVAHEMCGVLIEDSILGLVLALDFPASIQCVAGRNVLLIQWGRVVELLISTLIAWRIGTIKHVDSCCAQTPPHPREVREA